MADPPLLRSPPFPDVTPAVAAVSLPRGDGGIPDDADTGPLFAAIRAARVGGSFWADPVSLDRPHAILRPTSAADCRRILALIASEQQPLPPLVLLPKAGWAARLAGSLRGQGIRTIAGAVDPWSLLAPAHRLYVRGDDELAALALIAGTALHLQSAGRFADPGAVARHILGETRYRDPFTGASCPLDTTMEQLADWRRMIDANRGIAAAAGIARWKRREIAAFLWAPRPRRLRFPRPDRALAVARRADGGVAIWPSRVPAGFAARAKAADVPVIRLEDGFIRSVGLGSNLHPPLSIAVDARGIYYDPTRPSDLEHILATSPFPRDLIARAEALRAAIIAAGISKYGGGGEVPIPRPPGRRLVLVAGQVEDDMSVLLGGGGVAGNHDLLRRARALEPDAEIWFRPHPDVDAGHRRGRIADAEALRLADRVVRGGGMARLLDRVDGVHVLTSLTGFEALLRGRDVTVHGLPFFAGWGLTRDLAETPPRRARRLTLAELIAATLILYPRYLDPLTRLPCPPEVLIARFATQVAPRMTWLTRLRGLQGRLLAARR